MAVGVLGTACLLLGLVGCGSSSTKTYVMPSESMAPTFEPEEEITVDLDAYSSAEPEVGDAVVFHPPAGVEGGVQQCGVRPKSGEPCPTPTAAMSDQLFLKRIVAGPGDRLSIKDGHPVLNGKVQRHEPFTIACGNFGACNMPRTITIPSDYYFMLGDNRPASDDSRFWGPVPRGWILGRVEG